MKLLTCILLFCLAATAFGQYNSCRMMSFKVTVTRRVCQRACIPFRGQYVACTIARAGQIISLCPSTCCRIANSCHHMQHT